MNIDTLLEAAELIFSKTGLKTKLHQYMFCSRALAKGEDHLVYINDNKCKYVTQEMYDSQLTLTGLTNVEVPSYIVASYLKNNHPDLYCEGFIEYATKLVELEDIPAYKATNLELQNLKKRLESIQEDIMEYLQ